MVSGQQIWTSHDIGSCQMIFRSHVFEFSEDEGIFVIYEQYVSELSSVIIPHDLLSDKA